MGGWEDRNFVVCTWLDDHVYSGKHGWEFGVLMIRKGMIGFTLALVV